jgi:hypothetical protein
MMEQQQPGLGGFPGFQGKQKQRQNTNPNAAFNRPVGMMPNQAPPQMPPPVQNQLPVNPQMNRPAMPMRPSMPQLPMNRPMQMPQQSQVPLQVMQNPPVGLQEALARIRGMRRPY